MLYDCPNSTSTLLMMVNEWEKKLLQVLLNWINYFLQERFKGNTLNYEQIKSY